MCSLDEEFSYFKQMFFLTLTYFGVEPKMLCKYCKHIYNPTVYSPTVYSPTVYSPTVYSPTDLLRDIFQFLDFKRGFRRIFQNGPLFKGGLARFTTVVLNQLSAK